MLTCNQYAQKRKIVLQKNRQTHTATVAQAGERWTEVIKAQRFKAEIQLSGVQIPAVAPKTLLFHSFW